MKLSVISRRISALLLLSPLMLLTACGMQQKPQVEYRTVKIPAVSLPTELTSRIDIPAVPDGMTFGESVEMNAQLYGLIEQCNIDRVGIRQIEASRQ